MRRFETDSLGALGARVRDARQVFLTDSTGEEVLEALDTLEVVARELMEPDRRRPTDDYARGRADERTRIVARLRANAYGLVGPVSSAYAAGIANTIEKEPKTE